MAGWKEAKHWICDGGKGQWMDEMGRGMAGGGGVQQNVGLGESSVNKRRVLLRTVGLNSGPFCVWRWFCFRRILLNCPVSRVSRLPLHVCSRRQGGHPLQQHQALHLPALRRGDDNSAALPPQGACMCCQSNHDDVEG